MLALNCLAAEPRAGELHGLRDAAHPQKLWGANADALEEVVEQVHRVKAEKDYYAWQGQQRDDAHNDGTNYDKSQCIVFWL